jgi:hypothetical protein
MARADDLNRLLGGEDTPPPPIRRGRGVALSTDAAPPAEAAQSQNRKIAQSQNRTDQAEPAVVRINRGYALREDLVRACKVAAIEDGKKLYQIMEAALEQYLAVRAQEK